MGYKAEDITVHMSPGQRAAGLNHIAALRHMMYGDSSAELKRFISDMRNPTDSKAEQNRQALGALLYCAGISKERHSVDFDELTSDEKQALIAVMNHFRAVVSLFPKRLTLSS